MFRCITALLGCILFHTPVVSQSSPPDRPDDSFSLPQVLDGAAIFHLSKNKNLCAITFDDGPGPHTERLLHILRQHGVQATFFVVGSQVKRRPKLVQQMLAEGHEVANHTYAHTTLRHMPLEQQQEAIGDVQKLLQELGATSRFVRPPFGRYDITTRKAAKELGVQIVLWSVDSHDWQRRTGVAGLKSVGGGPGVRGVFLFHDTHAPTVDAMSDILSDLSRECRFVTMSEYAQAVQLHNLPPAEQCRKTPNAELSPAGTSGTEVVGTTPVAVANILSELLLPKVCMYGFPLNLRHPFATCGVALKHINIAFVQTQCSKTHSLRR